MASLDGQVDPGAQSRSGPEFSLLPAGRYVGRAIKSEVALTKAGTGTILKLTWELASDGYRGRRIWQTMIVTNPNAWAQQRGRDEMTALKKAVGIHGRLARNSDLHERRVGLIVAIELSKDPKYQDKNIVVGFFPADTTTPAYAATKP